VVARDSENSSQFDKRARPSRDPSNTNLDPELAPISTTSSSETKNLTTGEFRPPGNSDGMNFQQQGQLGSPVQLTNPHSRCDASGLVVPQLPSATHRSSPPSSSGKSRKPNPPIFFDHSRPPRRADNGASRTPPQEEFKRSHQPQRRVLTDRRSSGQSAGKKTLSSDNRNSGIFAAPGPPVFRDRIFQKIGPRNRRQLDRLKKPLGRNGPAPTDWVCQQHNAVSIEPPDNKAAPQSAAKRPAPPRQHNPASEKTHRVAIARKLVSRNSKRSQPRKAGACGRWQTLQLQLIATTKARQTPEQPPQPPRRHSATGNGANPPAVSPRYGSLLPPPDLILPATKTLDYQKTAPPTRPR